MQKSFSLVMIRQRISELLLSKTKASPTSSIHLFHCL